MANVLLHDVYMNADSLEDYLRKSDVVFIATPHREYKADIEYYKRFLKSGAIVVDIWNILNQNSIFFKV